MSLTTKIQWCDSTVNPTMGCDGCELWNSKAGVRKCYAGVLHSRFGRVTKGYSPTFDQLTLWPGRMAEAAGWADLTGRQRPEKPWLNGLPRLVFVSDMSDALSEGVSLRYLETEIINTATSPKGRRHHWLWLTKRPQRMAELSDKLRAKGIEWPDNVWAGTSITAAGTTSRIKHLLRVGNDRTIRFLSVEPQHEAIDLSGWLSHLEWVIQGGESGRGASPFRLAWASDLLRQCRAAGTAYFLKQLGAAIYDNDRRLSLDDGHGGDWAEWPKELRVREMPEKARRYQTLFESDGDRSPAVPEVITTGRRIALEVTGGIAPGRAAALRAWETRRANEKGRQRSEAAKRAWRTRKENAAESKKL